ncbi:MAG: hypothetical protein HZB51_23575 [Chloroflexi bacterium]|nr:hypothetical protein [Chloroflexota bacterium]
MRCVKCDEPIRNLNEPCAHCHFQGDPALGEELLHVKWLLGQVETLNRLGIRTVRIVQHYTARQRELEIQLGLRLASLTPAQLREMQTALAHHTALLHQLDAWLAIGWLTREAVQPIIAETNGEIRELQRQLEGHARSTWVRTDSNRLAVVEFLLTAVERIGKVNGFASTEVETSARATLLAEKEKLEIKLGLRKPQPIPVSRPPEKIAVPSPEAVPPQPPAPREPQLPLRDRFWRTLLSERTLQAMLFLGIFLLFSAAISFVVYGWQNFSAPLRVAIPTLFTLIFLALGWYVRQQTRMYRSGIALTTIAALLIPVDFYTLYVNFNIPPDHTPIFWFVTSLVCLAAYVLITRLTQSGLFGYLVGAAAGSIVVSLIEIGNQHFALARDWNVAALSILAVILMLIATRVDANARWRVMAEPFRNLALIAAGAIMLLAFGWRYINRSTYDPLHYAMTLSWWLGSFLFGWGAIHYRSRTLGILAAMSLPIATFFAQAALFNQTQISPAWHAFGLALLVPIYLTVGNRLLARQDKILKGHGRTATGWGVALTIVAALWSLTNMTSSTAAASTHAVLFGAMVLATWLWRQPRILYAASIFALTTMAFAMTELNLSPNQFSVGWASLAIACLIFAYKLDAADWHARLVSTFINIAFIIAALSLVPAFLPYNGSMLAYALGNWLGLAAWSARLAHAGRPGFASTQWFARARFDWMTALPLPVWIWIVFANRGPIGYDLPLALAALAWGMVALSYRLRVSLRAVFAKQSPTTTKGAPFTRSVFLAMAEDVPWYSVGLIVSIVAFFASLFIARNGFTPAICLLSAGLLYFADAVTNRQRFELIPGAFVTAWGWAWLLDRAHISFDAVTFALAMLITVYVFVGLWLQHRRSPTLTAAFIAPLYWASHALAFIVLLRVANTPLVALFYRRAWTDEMRLWQAAGCILLGVVYACYAWASIKERWAHAAAWLFAAGGGLVALSYSTGTGSLAARAALGAMVYVLGERILFWWRQNQRIRFAWTLYRRPLLIAGWLVSIGVIGVALVRNLFLLGGGRTQQIWAVVALTMIVALYALSARMFRLARFVWFAGFLAFIPWTIMTNLGWLVTDRPRTSAFAIGWVALAWLAYLVGWLVRRFAPSSYALPLRVFTHLLLPFALLWGIANADASRITFFFAILLYALEAFRDARELRRNAALPSSLWRTALLYPAVGLVPIWYVYLLNLVSGARHEHYGLLLLTFGVLGLLFGQLFERIAPRREMARSFGLPAYLTGYVATIVGTLLVAHEPGLLALVLLYDALLMLVSTRLFKDPLWAFASAAIAPFSFWLALNTSTVPGNRHGWWLLGLASIYLLLAWSLRRTRLAMYDTAPLTIAFALIAFALPPSTQDQTGAFLGYAGASILYTITAFWLRQPLLLTPACALALVPYAVGLQQSTMLPEYYGLALFPGALVLFAIGWLLDKSFGAWREFPWSSPLRWGIALAERWSNWWALPLYVFGFGLVAVSPFFTNGKQNLAALNFLLAMPIGVWAIYRFRLRLWLFATIVAAHCAAYLYLVDLGWRRLPSELALRFVPITIITAILALIIERWRKEESPLTFRFMPGWSYPLYLIVLFDIWLTETLAFSGTQAHGVVSLANALLIAVLASFWLSSWLPYVSAVLGIVALLQYMGTQAGYIVDAPIPLAQLALAYGLNGFALQFYRERQSLARWLGIWEKPLQQTGLILSFCVLMFAAILGVDIARWTARALFGFSFRNIVDLATVQMLVGVFALLGLLYLAAAFSYRMMRSGYFAIAMLLAAWMLHAFYVQRWDGATNVQWYALPAGLYLLGVSFLEWQRGNHNLARWIDYAAVVLMMGSLFWQTLLYGWSYALLLGAEGFAAFWWGSARRLRRFLYAGMMGVVLATLAQLINALQSINQWLVFGIIGLIVVIAAILIERRIEDVKALRQIFETWE